MIFPLPKVRTLRFSLHTSRLSLLKWSPLCGTETRNEFTLSVAITFRPLCSDSLARAVRWVIKNSRQMNQILPSPILCVRYFRWERERERERRKWVRRKWRHHCRAKIGDEFTLSLAKNSHFSFLPSHFPSLPSRRGHHCGAEIRNEFTFSIAKNFFALFVPPLSNGTSRATSDRKPKTNDRILPSPILFFPTKKWIKLIPKTIGNRKRDCAWGDSGW